MRIKIYKLGSGYMVDPIDKPGSPSCGRGRTMDQAIADFIRIYQKELGLEIEVDGSAMPTEMRRRQRELRKR